MTQLGSANRGTGRGKANLHNHTVWSDGECSVEEIITAARRFGLAAIALTDHLQTVKTHSIPYTEIAAYLRHCRDSAAENAGNLDVLVGLEINGGELSYDLDILPYDELNTCDLILVENVNYHGISGISLDRFLTFRKRLEIPVGLAHTDAERCFPDWHPEDLGAVFAEENIFFELNFSYRRPREGSPYYIHAEELIKSSRHHDFKLSVGSDTHNSVDELHLIRHAYDYLERLGLTDRIIFDYF